MPLSLGQSVATLLPHKQIVADKHQHPVRTEITGPYCRKRRASCAIDLLAVAVSVDVAAAERLGVKKKDHVSRLRPADRHEAR